MITKLLGAAAALGALMSATAMTATADPTPTPTPTPPPYCAGNDPGDFLNGITCDEEVSSPDVPVSTRPSDPPPGGGLPGGPGGGGPGGPGGGPGGPQ